MTLQRRVTRTLAFASLLAAATITGCQERTGFLPNPDTALRREEKEFVADAAKRHPFKEDAPRGTANARAEVDYMYRYLGIVNLSDQHWNDVEVWVNRQFVVYVPKWQDDTLKRIQFSMLRDERGNPFTSDGGRRPVQRVEVYTDGKMYEIPLVLAE